MEKIQGITLSPFSSYHQQPNTENAKKDKLKEIIPAQNESLQHLMCTYSRFNKKASTDIYEVNCRKVIKSIQDINLPVNLLTVGGG